MIKRFLSYIVFRSYSLIRIGKGKYQRPLSNLNSELTVFFQTNQGFFVQKIPWNQANLFAIEEVKIGGLVFIFVGQNSLRTKFRK